MRHREQWYEYITKKYPNSVAVSVANVEPSVSNEPVAAKKTKRHDRLCRVLFRSYRHRLADPDGLCGKYALDSLVSWGVFKDDSTQYIQSVSHEQVKISKKEQEKTEIIITEV